MFTDPEDTPEDIPSFLKIRAEKKDLSGDTPKISPFIHFIRCLIIIPVILGMLLLVTLMLLGWVYEGPRRLLLRLKFRRNIKYEV